MALSESRLLGTGHVVENIAAPGAAPASGEVLKLADKRAGVVTGLNLSGVASGDAIAVVTSGPVAFAKASAKTFSAGAYAFWDVSANSALPAGDGALVTADVRLGTVLRDAGSGALEVEVSLNSVLGADGA